MAKKNTSNKVESIRHKDKRKNIPTEELRDFVAQDENAPKVMLYPRDPSLDPQLVWKGKDEQDREDLAVPVVPIYIQEKIHPQAIIEQLPRIDHSGGQLDLFADFNGLPEEFSDRVDFYHHEGNWSNRMILGDSLLVMTSLAEKEGLKGKVQTIYLDPPYGIKFGSNWQVSTRKRDVKDGKAEDATRQPEQVRAFRDTWQLGIHSYLAYLRDRLTVARELLTESGSVFVQIGDENVHLVRCLLDEVFGAENFAGQIIFQKTGWKQANLLSTVSDTILWYAKNLPDAKYRQLWFSKLESKTFQGQDIWVEQADGERFRIPKSSDLSALDQQNYRLFRHTSIKSAGASATGTFSFTFGDREFHPGFDQHWKTTSEGLQRLSWANRLLPFANTLEFVSFLDDFPCSPFTNIWTDTVTSGFSDEKIYVVQTSSMIIERCLLMTTDPGDLVLDPTCGSGTTAYVAEQWGRRWITIDTSRVALALARTRLMTAKYPYYLLADSPEGVKKETELTAQVPPPHKTEGDIRKGFVYKRVPHVTLKSIANNPEIDEIHARWQPTLDKLRDTLNRTLGQKWEEWEVPRDWPPSPIHRGAGTCPAAAKKAHEEFWQSRRERQAQIDAAIARHAETETLYDQPYEDNKTVRVTGPFTVESLSPHRTISVEEKKRLAEEPSEFGFTTKMLAGGQFANVIIENLIKAGVQNTKKGERLKFDRLEVHPGVWIHAEGEYTERDGTRKRVGVCIGPEHGTVGPELVKEAAKEAVLGIGFDLLLVCGFAFDPHVSEEARRYGKLTVLPVRMNPDLSMGEDLLKKTGAGNLFMVFGEPDVEIRKVKGGQIVVEIKGVDVYDPTTGAIRSSSTDDIACWFIDTDYNAESFFVRHAYFTGAEEPYDKLKRALRAEIDEAAWSELYSTTSRPFDPPEGKEGKPGKIAVKVINHYGDEVLKVFEINSKSTR
ncbi:MAG TPA: site-specific DNA-methyltransferase [Sedimentisphaerales bacterium]|nr:site-specific DNA-methyltransferase [Sedimentisphaerales bacterium]HRS09938.1 site-specific DNA-methyltransferase [Sedimentisphaerales bacterium]HRV46644.1 site-specific DNA-methyltransferase [Sedimentisphaerales bacterium]